MQKFKEYIFGFLILLVFILLSFGFGYSYNKNHSGEQSVMVSKSDTLYLIDTSGHSEVHNHFHTTNVYESLPLPGNIDTGQIIRNYFTKRFVADTINDSLLQFAIFDTLYNNQIASRTTKYKLLKPYEAVVTTTYIPLPVSQMGFYAGAFLGFNKSFIQSAGVEANLVTNKINYGLGYDFKNNAVTGKVLFRIGKSKQEKQLMDLLKLKPVK